MQQLLFDKDLYLSVLATRFANLEIGRFHSSLPLEELGDLLPKRKNPSGAKGWFTASGKIALQFLKMYSGLSDEKLLERLNTDWSYQIFCGISLGINEEIKDPNLICRIRKEVAESFEVNEYQSILIKKWLPWLKNTHIAMCDASAYESYITFPTDVKLLWSCIEWLNEWIRKVSKIYGINLPRNRFKDIKATHISYMKRRRKSKKIEKRHRRRLLYLCNKLIGQLEEILATVELNNLNESKELTSLITVYIKLKLVKKIQSQQQFHYDNPGEPVPDRIVSLYKSYLRPIVRGKEKKRVEFGAKVHAWQVDGINFIEYLSFNAFHEGVRLKQSIAFHTKYFGKLSQLGADGIYANRANRAHCKALGIQTCFKPVGRRTTNDTVRKQEDQIRKEIGRARATIMEGSFGNEKNHYNLQKVKARSEATEILFIFFGIMTANAVKIGKRMKNKVPLKTALKIAA